MDRSLDKSMNKSTRAARPGWSLRLSLLGVALLGASGLAAAEDAVQLAGATCSTPAPLHCPDEGCSTDRVINPGAVVEMKTRRTYFLDYPCDLEPGEDVTFILSLHGAGSYANWQRHYFPLLDYKDEYRLVIATPSSPIRFWTEADDTYLENIVESVVEQLGKDNIQSFWLVGHSQGGMTSNRLLRTDFFAQRVDGWLSLSGGRLGGNPPRAESFGPPRARQSSESARPSSGSGDSDMAARFAAYRKLLEELPEQDFSFIYTTGEREVSAEGVPETSAWAEKLGCKERVSRGEVVDKKAGYVYDGTRQDPPNPAWGLLPAPGKATVNVYTGCKDGRVVADVVRLEKGHTEGLEPEVTKTLIELMQSAEGGGKIRSR